MAIRETKKELQQESKGYTAAEAAEYVALGNAIDDAREAEEKQASINKEASGIADSLMSEEASIIASYERRRDIILDSTNKTGEAQKNLLIKLENEKKNLLIKLENEKNGKITDLNASFWEKYVAAAEDNLQNFNDLSKTVIDSFASGIGDAFESAIFDAEDFGDAMDALSETILRTVVNSIAQVAVQWAIAQALRLADIGTETAAVVAAEGVKTGAVVTAEGTKAGAVVTAEGVKTGAVVTAEGTKTAAVVTGATVASGASIAATAATTTASVASAGTVAAAWLPAALVASIGSFGAAAVVGGTALLAAYALIGGFQDGGYTGDGAEGEVAGVVHGKEFVMDAAATRRIGAGNLEKMSRGESVPSIGAQGGSGGSGGGGISIVINDQTTTSTGHDVQTQETTGPEGQRQMQVTIRDTVRRQMMSGEFDKQLGSKFDLKSKGRRV